MRSFDEFQSPPVGPLSAPPVRRDQGRRGRAVIPLALVLLAVGGYGWQWASETSPPTAGARNTAAPNTAAPNTAAPTAVKASDESQLGNRLAAANVGCSATACHGDALNKPARDWTNSHTAWSVEDPHRRATELLFTPRAREIYWNLEPQRRGEEKIDATDYDAFLRQRCLTCHATADSGHSTLVRPAARPANGPGPELTFQRKLAGYLEGVTCAACHGDATDWVNQHYLRSWPEAGAERSQVARSTGFLDLRDRQQAAQVCARCHVGQPANDQAVDQVNHDLIAAGHPRLRFELDTYLTNLPTHWNRARSDERYRATTGGSPHVDAWRQGQAEHARRLLYLTVQDPRIRWSNPQSSATTAARAAAATADKNGAGADRAGAAGSGGLGFAAYQCFDCHQSLATWERPKVRVARLARRESTPRLAAWPLENVLLFGAAASVGEAAPEATPDVARLGPEFLGAVPVEGGERQRVLAARLEAQLQAPLSVVTRAELPRHAQLLVNMLDRCLGKAEPASSTAVVWKRGWDEAIDWLFAVRALEADWPAGPARESLTQALTQYQDSLQEKHDGQPLARYDSPTEFDPARLREPLLALRAVLVQLADSRAEAEKP
ncbi:MAG: multiheme c-type cytochrome [Planctomycetota bacterium]